MPPASGPPATTFTPGPTVKLGAMKKKCGGFRKWAVRYLILDKPNRILYYYHSPKDASPRRSLDLNTCTISRLSPEESPKDPGFKVTQPGVRDFIFIGSNAAIVDDWVNAIFQAKAPSSSNQQMQRPPINNMVPSPTGPGYNIPSPVKNSTASSDSFSYNGPTLAVLPNRGSHAMASPPTQTVPVPTPGQNIQPQYQPPGINQGPNRQSGLPPVKKPTPQSAQSTQSTVTDNAKSANNTTLVGNGGDTNSTLVAGGQGGGGPKIAAGQPIPVLILTPDNKKFAPIERGVVGIIRIGRYVNNQPASEDMITFKSKVISRNHAEIWSVNGEVYIRDTKSQSGTFLNAMRLSEPSKESKPYRLKPGDVIQFGVDYKGATEDNARCISVRVDLKTKVMEPAVTAGPGDGTTLTGENNDTLVGGGDGTTLVQGAKQNDSTLYGDKNANNMQHGQFNAQPPPPGMQRPPMMMPNGMQGRPPMGMRPPMRPPMGM